MAVTIFIALGAVFASGLWSRPVRDAYTEFIGRTVAKVMPPTYVLAGDSLTADGPWRRLLGQHLFGAANLARPGASIAEVAAQVRSAHAYHAEFCL